MYLPFSLQIRRNFKKQLHICDPNYIQPPLHKFGVVMIVNLAQKQRPLRINLKWSP